MGSRASQLRNRQQQQDSSSSSVKVGHNDGDLKLLKRGANRDYDTKNNISYDITNGGNNNNNNNNNNNINYNDVDSDDVDVAKMKDGLNKIGAQACASPTENANDNLDSERQLANSSGPGVSSHGKRLPFKVSTLQRQATQIQSLAQRLRRSSSFRAPKLRSLLPAFVNGKRKIVNGLYQRVTRKTASAESKAETETEEQQQQQPNALNENNQATVEAAPASEPIKDEAPQVTSSEQQAQEATTESSEQVAAVPVTTQVTAANQGDQQVEQESKNQEEGEKKATEPEAIVEVEQKLDTVASSETSVAPATTEAPELEKPAADVNQSKASVEQTVENSTETSNETAAQSSDQSPETKGQVEQLEQQEQANNEQQPVTQTNVETTAEQTPNELKSEVIESKESQEQEATPVIDQEKPSEVAVQQNSDDSQGEPKNDEAKAQETEATVEVEQKQPIDEAVVVAEHQTPVCALPEKSNNVEQAAESEKQADVEAPGVVEQLTEVPVSEQAVTDTQEAVVEQPTEPPKADDAVKSEEPAEKVEESESKAEEKKAQESSEEQKEPTEPTADLVSNGVAEVAAVATEIAEAALQNGLAEKALQKDENKSNDEPSVTESSQPEVTKESIVQSEPMTQPESAESVQN